MSQLHVAAEQALGWSAMVGVVEELLQLGADVSAVARGNGNVLHLVLGSMVGWNDELILAPDLFHVLVSHGADVGCRDAEGRLPIDVLESYRPLVFPEDRRGFDAVHSALSPGPRSDLMG